MTQAPHIYIVDDEAPAREMVGEYLKMHGFAVTLCDGGSSLREAIDTGLPDLVVLDLNMPEEDGLSIIRDLKGRGNVPVIMLTATASPIDRVVGLELGADDYIIKPFSFRELLSRVRAALRRAYGELASASGAEKVAFADVRVDLKGMRVERGDHGVSLTPTEYRLLRHLVTHPEQVFSRDSLLELVWGYENSVDSQRTVDVHMRHLREKLEEDPANPRWLVTVRGTGYMFSQKRNVNEV